MYCGEVVEISQPLFPIGMNTPISMTPSNAAVIFHRSKGRAIPTIPVAAQKLQPNIKGGFE
jgi:hypothetical protein